MRTALLASAGLIGALVFAPAQSATGSVADQPSATMVRLITGDRVLLGSTQEPLLLPADRHGVAGSMRLTQQRGHLYAVPAVAAPYIGRSLDLSLFDLTALATAERNGRLPVRVSYVAGARPVVPGLTLTDRNGKTGYFTTASARAFGRALVAQWESDHRPGHRVTAALFGGVTDIGLDVPETPAKVAGPNYPQVTLNIKVLDPDGKPAANGDVQLVNVDDRDRFNVDLRIVDGVARASVPLGNYSALAEVDVENGATHSFMAYQLTAADYRVAGDRQTLTLDARNAVPVAIRTPRPATATTTTTVWARNDSRGGRVSSSELYGEGARVYVTPTSKPKIGQLHWLTVWTLSGAPGRGLSYTYDATFEQANGIAANQTNRIANAQVARVDSRYYTDGPSRPAVFSRSPDYPYPYRFLSELLPATSPLHRIEYVVSPPNASWEGFLLDTPADTDPMGIGIPAEVDDGVRSLPAGSTHRVDWLRGPISPGAPTPGGAESGWTCPTCRTARSLTVDLAPVTDTTATHNGYVGLPSGGHAARFRLYRDGKLMHDEYDATGGTFTVPTASATYRMIDHVLRGQDSFLGSTSSTVDVTFRSAAGSGGTLPRGWSCESPGKCTVLPILQARIPLPTNLTGQLPVGRSVTAVNVDHVPGATHSAIRSVVLQTSFDGGKTWRKARILAPGGGKFWAVLENPRAQVGNWATLRLVVTDAAGGKLVETVSNAYSVK